MFEDWTQAGLSPRHAPMILASLKGPVLAQKSIRPSQDGQLMPQGDELELQGEATTNPEQEQGPESGQKREHADDGMTAAPETLHLLGFLEF